MERELIFLYDNLIYHIDNTAYIIGESVQDEELKQRIQDVTQKNNLDHIKSVLDLAYAEVNNLCYPYTKIPPAAPMGRDFNDLSDKKRYVIHLVMPPTTAKSSLELARERINEYFVWKVMNDWLKITAPDIAGKYSKDESKMGDLIQEALTPRMKTLSIKPSTF